MISGSGWAWAWMRGGNSLSYRRGRDQSGELMCGSKVVVLKEDTDGEVKVEKYVKEEVIETRELTGG